MKIGTIVFTYHRSEHTKKVINALAKNDILPEKLYIFQDGVKDSTNYKEWEKVNDFIKEQHWCKTEVQIAAKNKGLAESIVGGVNYALQECDAVIVLEDDCVPHKQFMGFMISSLMRYEKSKSVYSVSGYAWDIDLPNMHEDAYFNGRICSYGWGTWKDRWIQYEEDYNILSKIKNNPDSKERLQIWGQDLGEMLIGNVLGKCDSWAAFWALKVIEKGGYCLSSVKPLVKNIGFDGSGVHSAKLRAQSNDKEGELSKEFLFPQKIECTEDCQIEFKFLFAGKQGQEKLKLYQDVLLEWVLMRQLGNRMRVPDGWGKRIAVWGKGRVCDCFLDEIEGQVDVAYIIESKPSGDEYRGIPIISIKELPEDIKNIVVVPYFDLTIIQSKVQRIRPYAKLWGIDELLLRK